MKVSCNEVQAWHEEGIKNSRFFIRGTSEDKLVIPRYCNDVKLENMADDTEVVCLKSNGWDSPFIYRKSRGVVYELYRYRDTPYILQGMLADIEPSEVRVLNGGLCSMLFKGMRGGVIYWENSGKRLFIKHKEVSIDSTPDVFEIRVNGSLLAPDVSATSGKYIIPDAVIGPLLKEMRSSRNKGKFSVLDDVLCKRFHFDGRFI